MGDHKHWTVSNHNPLQTSSKSLFCKRILNTHEKQVIWLTTHSPSQHRTRPAEKKGFLGLQWVGVSYNEFRCKLKRIHRFLIESSIQPVCDHFQSFKEPSLVFQFHCIIPFIRQWHASCNINSKHKNTKILQSALPVYSGTYQECSTKACQWKVKRRPCTQSSPWQWGQLIEIFPSRRKSVMKWGYQMCPENCHLHLHQAHVS